jgi:hypothetical protein
VAVYDVDESRWTVAPAQDDIKLGIAGMVWDGETLALVQLSQGGGVDESLTLRWRPGDDRWTTGVPAPIAARLFVGSASDGRRLALWGGTTDHLTSSPGPGSEGELADGAIYDLAADRWTTIADGPVPGGVRPAVAWVDGRLVVGGGRDGLDASSQELVEVAAYDPATQTWSSRPAAPSDDGSEPRSPLRLAVLENTGVDRPLIADPIMGGNDTRLWFYGPDGEWEQSPLPNAQRLAGFWVATSPTRGEPDDTTPFSMQVRVAAGQWLDSAPASFANRDRANTTLVTSGNLLMVVGGHESADLDPATDVWLFDLAG